MCGIAGLWRPERVNGEHHDVFCNNILQALQHRGPDNSGIWRSENTDLTLFHRRLAIVDLSSGGHQPMKSHDGRYVVSYNGEIYNFIEIQNELCTLGVNFMSSSDTEVLLEAFSIWGIQKTLQKLNGMFAIALYDQKLKKLTLIRDRIGEKPLYYANWDGEILFASELKAFHKWDRFIPTISTQAVQAFLEFGFVPAPLSIYENVFKLKPGNSIDFQNAESSPQTSYWNLTEKINNAEKMTKPEDAQLKDLEELLSDAVSLRMCSDVPMGTFLSGGVDSSLVSAIVQSQSETQYSSFTIGFEDTAFDEAPAAQRIAKHIGTHHSEYQISNKELLEIVPTLPQVFCEPFADESQIPTMLVSHIARQEVTAILSGDGGDEVFGGYNRHISSKTMGSLGAMLPGATTNFLANLLRSKHQSKISWLVEKLGRDISSEQLNKLANVLASTDDQDIYRNYLSSPIKWEFLGQKLKSENFSDLHITQSFSNLTACETIMANDQLFYLPENILVKLDRASMAKSLETRVPFLDHRIIEFGWTIPLDAKIKGGVGKVLLRKLLYKYVPKDLFSVNKHGFNVPIANWLRTSLRDWAEELIVKSGENPYIDMVQANAVWDEHQSHVADHSKLLWNLLMFLAWLSHWH